MGNAAVVALYDFALLGITWVEKRQILNNGENLTLKENHMYDKM